MFQIENLNAGYGESQVLRDVSFGVAPRESVAVMGRNGMGKTTLLKALIGMLPRARAASGLKGASWRGWKVTSACAAAWPSCRRAA